MNKSKIPWIQVNQEYLMSAVKLVEAKLRLYQCSKKEDADIKTAQQTVEKAATNLEKVKTNLAHPSSLDILTKVLGLSVFETNLLLMCVGVELDAKFAQLISDLQQTSTQSTPTFSLALSVFPEAHWSALLPESPLRFWHLITLNKTNLLTQSPLVADEFILHYLTGIHFLDQRLLEFVSIYSSKGKLVESHQQLSEQLIIALSKFGQQNNYPLLHLTGKNHQDKADIAYTAFAHYNLTTYRLTLRLLPSNLQELTFLARLWNRNAALTNAALFIDGSDWNSMDSNTQKLMIYFIEQLSGVVVLGCEQQKMFIKKTVIPIEVKKPQRKEQQWLWTSHLQANGTSTAAQVKNLSIQFNFDAHTIRHLAQEANISPIKNDLNSSTQQPLKNELWGICCRHTRPHLDELSQRIEAIAQWDDLVLPPHQKEILRAISVHVKQRQKVYEQWGFASKSNRGLGICALFAGESGTGKTMASEVLAYDLGLDLYRIDLSQVVNKYIGETEKNLKKVFDAAEESGAILLFDEADALFGKRSEVKDSHDRYSNIEVSYLLQRIESYRGLAILTTNMKKSLDTAFLRRIRFVINFPFPDIHMRAEIWSKIFPSKTPTQNLDIRKLANLHIAGGNIKNIALNAAFMAAHKNQSVSMSDIQNAARNEYAKLEKQMSPSEILV